MSWIKAFALLCLLAAVRAQNGVPLSQQVLDEVYGDEIPGQAGVDYPVLATVPRTDFRCDNLPYPGYYADQEAYCQAFYICGKSGKGIGFLCPNGTLFNQEFLVCDWWNHVDCASASDFYSVNEAVFRAMEEVDAARQNGVYFNSRGEPISATGIPSRTPARLNNRFPNSGQPSTFGRLTNAPFLNTTPRPFGVSNAFNNYRRPLNALGALNNKYPYQSLGAFNNRYQYRPQGLSSNLNNVYSNVQTRPFNNAFNRQEQSKENGNRGNDKLGEADSGLSRNNTNRETLGNTERNRYDNVGKSGNPNEPRGSNDRLRTGNGQSLRDGKDASETKEGYFYDRPNPALTENGQNYGVVDPSKEYLPPLK